MKNFNLILAAALMATAPVLSARNNFTPGVASAWTDTSGKHINAHGCCVVYHDGTYYWFGEDRSGSTSNGISCYSSTDLYNWKRLGLVFKVSQANDPETGKCILERPKVIYNEKTKKWVMYIHWENGLGYGQARVCVATSDRIDGDYKFESTFRPNGHDSRDQTVFRDKDGKAYHFCATGMNTNINVALLSDDYLTTETNPVTEVQILKGKRLEAPAIIGKGDTYFGIFSGCSGWDPNPGHSAVAYDILGDWTEERNFAIDEGANTTYRSQSTYILKVEGYDNAYIYMGDRWNSGDVGGKSEYIWLPLSIRSGSVTVKWFDSWDLSAFENCDRYKRIAAPKEGAVVRILDKYSDRWISTKGNGLFIDNDNNATNLDFQLEATDNPYVWRFKDVASGAYLESVYGALRLNTVRTNPNQEWRLELQEDGTYRIQNATDHKYLAVSGGSQLAKTPVYMTSSDEGSVYFGLYFDCIDDTDTEAADMYSASYREANNRLIDEQYDYEQSAISDVRADIPACGARFDGSKIVAWSETPAEAPVTVVDAASGRQIFAQTLSLNNSGTAIAAPAAGIYIVSVNGVATKLAVN